MSLLFIIIMLKHIFINQNGNHYIQHIFASKKEVYSCSIKIHALGFHALLESTFCLLLVVKVCSLKKVVEMLEKVVVGERSAKYHR